MHGFLKEHPGVFGPDDVRSLQVDLGRLDWAEPSAERSVHRKRRPGTPHRTGGRVASWIERMRPNRMRQRRTLTSWKRAVHGIAVLWQ